MSVTHSKRAPEPVGLYPHARRVGNLLFLSASVRVSGTATRSQGVVAPNGDIADYDIAAQTRSVFENVRTILEDAGSSWERLVDVTVYLTNMKKDFPTYNRLWAEYFGKVASPPCRTTLEVGALPTPIAIELKCIATID